MASLVVLMAVVMIFGVMFGGIIAIAAGIRREDKRRTMLGRAPDWSCRAARRATGIHTARWA